MDKVIKIRPAQLLLSWQFDPLKQYPFAVEESLKASCGIIPDYFERALSVCEVVNIEEVALIMDDLDDDLPPYAALTSVYPARCDVECFIYPYDIVGLRDSSGNTKVARFD